MLVGQQTCFLRREHTEAQNTTGLRAMSTDRGRTTDTEYIETLTRQKTNTWSDRYELKQQGGKTQG